jgi:hypothetical protein
MKFRSLTGNNIVIWQLGLLADWKSDQFFKTNLLDYAKTAPLGKQFQELILQRILLEYFFSLFFVRYSMRFRSLTGNNIVIWQLGLLADWRRDQFFKMNLLGYAKTAPLVKQFQELIL